MYYLFSEQIQLLLTTPLTLHSAKISCFKELEYLRLGIFLLSGLPWELGYSGAGGWEGLRGCCGFGCR